MPTTKILSEFQFIGSAEHTSVLLSETSAAARYIRNRIERLVREVEEGDIAPSAAAVVAAEQSLIVLAEWDSDAFGRPNVTTIGDGDILFEWRGIQRDVLIFIAADGHMRIHSIEMKRGAISCQGHVDNPTLSAIGFHIRWFNEKHV
jgi:hypothetical protein